MIKKEDISLDIEFRSLPVNIVEKQRYCKHL